MPRTKRADKLQPGDRVIYRGDTVTVEASHPSQLATWWWLDFGLVSGGVPANHLFTVVR